jgi:hypothetical protein
MKKNILFPFLIVLAIVLACLAIMRLPALQPWWSPPADNTPLAEKVKLRLGIDLTNLESSLALTPARTRKQFVPAYSVPLKMEAATMGGYLPNDPMAQLRVLTLRDGDVNAHADISRQANGSYSVEWNTLFASYGKHTIRAQLRFPWTGSNQVCGPERIEIVTNILQWEDDDYGFGRQRTGFHGWLHTPSDYRIEIYDTKNVLVKSISATNKEVISEVWDYNPQNGQPNSAVNFTAKIFLKPLSTTNWMVIPYP